MPHVNSGSQGGQHLCSECSVPELPDLLFNLLFCGMHGDDVFLQHDEIV